MTRPRRISPGTGVKTGETNGDWPEGKTPYGNRFQLPGYIEFCLQIGYADGTCSFISFTSDLMLRDDVQSMVLDFLHHCENFLSEFGAESIGFRRITHDQYLAAVKALDAGRT